MSYLGGVEEHAPPGWYNEGFPLRRLLSRGSIAAAVAAGMTFALGVSTAQAAPVQQLSGDGPSVFIVGGNEATAVQGEVSIQYGGRHACTGSLITHRWVLTAAHCSVILIPGETKIRVGSLDSMAGGQLVGIKIKRVEIHPDYTGQVVRGDQALVKLDRRVRATPIPMALNPGKPGTLTRISGWGLTCKDSERPECLETPRRLQQLDTKVVSPSRCDLGENEAGEPIFNSATDVCIASADGLAKMACNGDSGGPLKRKMHGRWFLVGTTVGDGDDLEPHPNDCNTGPDGVTPGVGMWEKVGPSFPWIFQTLLDADPVAAEEFASTVRR